MAKFSLTLNKAAKEAMLAAFEAGELRTKMNAVAGSVAEYIITAAKAAGSLEKLDAHLEKVEKWIRSDEAAKLLKEKGYTVARTKDGQIMLPRAWVQAKSDVRATFRNGIPIKEVTSLSHARKLNQAARAAKKAAEEVGQQAGEGTQAKVGDNVQALKDALVTMYRDAGNLTEGQAAALLAQFDKLWKQVTTAPKVEEKAAGSRKAVH